MAIRSLTPLTWAAVYAGQTCIGHIIGRSRWGHEAYDVDDRSVGLFPRQPDAAKAIETYQVINDPAR
jgi:hypothetical protein